MPAFVDVGEELGVVAGECRGGAGGGDGGQAEAARDDRGGGELGESVEHCALPGIGLACVIQRPARALTDSWKILGAADLRLQTQKPPPGRGLLRPVRPKRDQPYFSHQSCSAAMSGPWPSASIRSALRVQRMSGPPLYVPQATWPSTLSGVCRVVPRRGRRRVASGAVQHFVVLFDGSREVPVERCLIREQRVPGDLRSAGLAVLLAVHGGKRIGDGIDRSCRRRPHSRPAAEPSAARDAPLCPVVGGVVLRGRRTCLGTRRGVVDAVVVVVVVVLSSFLVNFGISTTARTASTTTTTNATIAAMIGPQLRFGGWADGIGPDGGGCHGGPPDGGPPGPAGPVGPAGPQPPVPPMPGGWYGG